MTCVTRMTRNIESDELTLGLDLWFAFCLTKKPAKSKYQRYTCRTTILTNTSDLPLVTGK